MSSNKGRQNDDFGFGIIGILVVVIVLAVVGGASWFVYDKQKSKNTEVDSNKTSQKTGDSTSKTDTSAKKVLACLEQDDYKYMNYDKQPGTVTYDKTYDSSGSTLNRYDHMFFKPDSTTEDIDLSAYDDWADFATHAKDKQWKFRLNGSVYGSDAQTAASQKLANDRAERVHSQLVSRGVPETRFVIDAPHDYSNEAQENNKSQIYRSVKILIDPTCTQ